jgi:phytoene synthase
LPRELKPAFSALWNLDLAFADVVATSSDPRLGAIRLAWWRERLEDLDEGKAARGEPRLEAIAEHLLPRGVSGGELSRLEDAWTASLEPFPWAEPAAEGLQLRGRILFGIGGRLLSGQSGDAQDAGAFWSLVDGARHCSDRASADYLLSEAKSALGRLPKAAPRGVRGVTVLAALSAADLLAWGSGLARFAVVVRHRLTGAFPRG